MAYKKFVKKAKKYVKKRYTTKSGGVKLQQVARDVMKIKRSLNTEKKHIDFNFGSQHVIGVQTPNQTTPILVALDMPTQGVQYNQRVGNQIKITHMKCKYEVQFRNTTDLYARRTLTAQILFAKSADDIPSIEKLYHPDTNGNYTRMSMTNGQEWNKYRWIKPLTVFQSHEDKVARFPQSNVDRLYPEPNDPQSEGSATATGGPLHIAEYYPSRNCKTSITVMFQNLSNNVEQMKPYLLLRSNTSTNSPHDDHDPVFIAGTIRMTYVDN